MHADKHIDVFKDIIDGLFTGYLEGPFKPNSPIANNITLSPLQSVPRPDGGKERIIHNLSKNKRCGCAVNSFINPEFTKVKYTTIRAIVKLFKFIGPNGYACVWDMLEAYRQVKIRPEFRNFLGFKWYGRIYRYAALPFGLASAPKLYSEFAELQRQIIIHCNPNLWHIDDTVLLFNYLDDFWSAHTSYGTAWKQFTIFLQTLAWLGIPTQWRKVSPPSQIVKLLGFIFDLKNQIFYVPRAKVLKICEYIDYLLESKSCSRREMASIKGKLLWCTQVIRPTKAFLRGFDYYICNFGLSWDEKSMRISNKTKEDLLFWKAVLQSAHNSISFDYYLRNPCQGNIHVWTDAAIRDGTGIGGFTSNKLYFQVSWEDIHQQWLWPRNDSSGPELLAVVVIGTFLSYIYPNSSILFHCDNESVVPMINHEVCALRKFTHMALVRYFVATMFHHRTKYWIEHIPGEYNIEADNLSRFKHSPLKRLYNIPHPSDEWIKPFYDRNPNFNNSDTFQKIDLLHHTLYCLDLASCNTTPIVSDAPGIGSDFIEDVKE